MNVCPHKAWQDVPLNGRKCVDCGMWLEDYPETRPQPTTSVDAEQVWREAWDAYHGEPWPRSLSESEQATTVIQAYGDARADAARREALEEAAEEADEYASWHDGHDDGLSGFGKMAEGARELAAAIRALKENSRD